MANACSNFSASGFRLSDIRLSRNSLLHIYSLYVPKMRRLCLSPSHSRSSDDQYHRRADRTCKPHYFTYFSSARDICSPAMKTSSSCQINSFYIISLALTGSCSLKDLREYSTPRSAQEFFSFCLSNDTEIRQKGPSSSPLLQGMTRPPGASPRTM